MCGLVGMAGDMWQKHRDVMKDMLFFNTLRGQDSTGVSSLNMNRNEISTRKMTIPGYEFVQTVGIDGLLSPVPGFWLGHGRARTVGSVSRLNAHPFEIRTEDDTIAFVGAHNGTLRNKDEIERLLDQKFGTDSEAFLNLIYQKGLEEAIPKVEGAWALTWWDSDDNSINLLRNKERPLCYAYTHDRKVLIWASEAWMIRIACERHNVKLSGSSDDKDKPVIWSLAEDTHLKWKIPSFSYQSKKEEDKAFSAPERKGGLLGKVVEKKVFQPTQWLGYNRHNGSEGTLSKENDAYERAWNRHVYGVGAGFDDLDDDLPFSEAEKKAFEKSANGGEKTGQEPGPDQVVGFEGKLEDRDFVEELKRSGCDWCSGSIPPDAPFAWLDDMSLCCRNCLNGSKLNVDELKPVILIK